MRAASSAPVGARAAGAAAAAVAGMRWSSFRWGAGGGGERRGGALVVRGRRAVVCGEPGGVGLAGGEAVEAGVVEAHGGDAQLRAPEVLAPVAAAVAQAVGVDQLGQGVGGVAALGEHFDGAGDLGEAAVVESLAGP